MLLLVVGLIAPVFAQCPKLNTPPGEPGCPTIQDNALIGISSHESQDSTVRAVLTYSEPMAELLDCIWFNESGRGTRMIGDYGMAFGHYQWWLSLHPDMTYDCAMDYDCSTKKTAEAIEAGHSSWWTTYSRCAYLLNK